MSKLNGFKLSEDDFWNFSIVIYRQSEVQTILLQGQEELGANVNLALLCLWASQNNLSLSRNELQQLHAEVTSFNVKFTRAIRQLRNNFKTQQKDLDKYDEIRAHLLGAELLLERQEQSVLVQTLAQIIVEISRLSPPESSSNIESYQDFLSDINAVQPAPELNLCDLNQYISEC